MTKQLKPQFYESTTIDISDEDVDSSIPNRVPIGWNYQNVNTRFHQNGQATTSGRADTQLSKGASSSSKADNFLRKGATPLHRHPSTDEVEVLEVVSTSSRTATFPPSSSRREIRSIICRTTQAPMEHFFSTITAEDKKKASVSREPSSKQGKSKRTSHLSLSYKSLRKERKQVEDPPDTPQPMSPKANGTLEEPVAEEEGKKSPNHESEEPKITSQFSRQTVQKFIDQWRKLKPFTRDEEKIKDKIWKYYEMSHCSYTQSRKFISDLEKATKDLIKIDNIYLYISKLINCLKRYKDEPYLEKKKIEKINEATGETENKEVELSSKELKKQRKMKKVEDAMVNVAKKIKKLEEADVDLDDEVNSSYLLLDRLKTSFVKLDELYCKLADCSTFTGRPVEKKFLYEGSRYPEINKRITIWVNMNRCFPDYCDILQLVKSVTERDNLPLRPETVRVQAQEIFRDVGRILKKRREQDDLYSIYAYADDHVEEGFSCDPAADDDELCEKLKNNEKQAKENLDKVFQRFVDEEILMKDKMVEGVEEKNDEDDEDDEETPQMEKAEEEQSDVEDAANSLTGYYDDESQSSLPDLAVPHDLKEEEMPQLVTASSGNGLPVPESGVCSVDSEDEIDEILMGSGSIIREEEEVTQEEDYNEEETQEEDYNEEETQEEDYNEFEAGEISELVEEETSKVDESVKMMEANEITEIVEEETGEVAEGVKTTEEDEISEIVEEEPSEVGEDVKKREAEEITEIVEEETGKVFEGIKTTEEDEYFTEEDVEIALSPPAAHISSLDLEIGYTPEDDSVAEVTCFKKRKAEETETTSFPKRPCPIIPAPEVVEID